MRGRGGNLIRVAPPPGARTCNGLHDALHSFLNGQVVAMRPQQRDHGCNHLAAPTLLLCWHSIDKKGAGIALRFLTGFAITTHTKQETRL